MDAHSLEVEGLTAGYGGELVIEKVSFRLEGPQLAQILGPNGAGKTTLIKAILGLMEPISGRVIVDGVDITGDPKGAGPIVGYVPQLFGLEQAKYPVTAWELVESSYFMHRSRWPRLFSSDEVKAKIEKALKIVGLDEEAWRKSLWNLSGGQRQRVLLARAIVHDPPVLILDEPLSAVDPSGRAEIASFIGSLADEKLVLVSTHDPMLLLRHTRTVILVNKRFYAVGSPDEVLKLEVLSRVYAGAAIQVREHVHISDMP